MEQTTSAGISDWQGEHWSIIGPSWPGYGEIKHLIIFGDSYSQTSSIPQKAPTEDEPLGTPFPGTTYTEGPPNWVGHLIKRRRPPLLVHNYARGGHTVSGVSTQVIREFMKYHPPAIPWTNQNTLFCTWVGINDLAFSSDPQANINALFELQQFLYEKGARNFLFTDVPPVDRSPAYERVKQGAKTRFFNWNIALDKAMRSFVAEKSTTDDPITAIYFSAHKSDIEKSGGSIWVDHLHPTSAVHLVVANELDTLLSSISPFVVEETNSEK